MVTPLILLLPLPAAFAASITGQVLTWPEGEPMSGVAVVAWDLRLNYQYDHTDADGRYTIDELPEGSWRVEALTDDTVNRLTRFYPDARDYCDGSLLELGADDALTGVDFALVEGGTLTGRLVDSAGEPVAGATLTAEGVDDAVDGLEREATTDEDGRFSLTGLDADEGDSSAWTTAIEVDGWPDQLLGPTYDDEDAEVFFTSLGEDQDLGDRALLDGILVRGSVTGPDGPVPGAYVHVYSNSQVVTVESLEDGTFEAGGLPPGEVLPWASADGLATTYWPDVDRPEDYQSAPEEGDVLEDMDLTLPLEAIFNARLIAEDDSEDLSGVTALLYNDTYTVGAGTRAEEDGGVSIGALYGGDYTLYVFSADEGYADDFIRDEDSAVTIFTVTGETENATIDVALARHALLRGVVTDETGAPVDGAYVLAWPLDEQDDGPTVGVSDEEGVYEVNGLIAGRYQVQARYSPWCDADPSYVSVWWPDDQVYDALAGSMTLADDDRVEDLDFVLPRDGEQDSMGDAWEESHGLDTSRDDGADDADGDGYTNLEEYLLGTDPADAKDDPGGGGCGCGGGKAASLLWLGALGLARRRRVRS